MASILKLQKRIAILSEIHSNLEALTHAINVLKDNIFTDIYCSGDLLEYPGNANEIIRILQQAYVKFVMGNNDVSYFEQLDCSDFVPNQYGSFELPQDELTEDNTQFLENLPEYLSEIEFYLVHGLPPDSF